ncbi:MAG: ABC transporter permease subunit [Defluviitaleaceae bacterium]|nr:ABC transporter permease subunit [Defluviitaleaceae bacterium]
MLPIYKKEIKTYFTQMTGYIFLTFMVLLTAIYFVLINVFGMDPRYYAVLSGTTILFFVLIPTLTMRLFSEESRHKTDQLLYTCPLSIGQIVLGKFFAAVSLFLIGMAATVLFPFILSRYGELPVSQIAGAFIGFILIGICFVAVGLFISVLTDNQIIAAVATFATLFALFIMDAIANSMPVQTAPSLIFVGALIVGVAAILYSSTKNILASIILAAFGIAAAVAMYFINNLIFDGFIVKTLQWLSVYSRFENLTNGILNFADILYYVSFAALFIYLTVNVIEKRRWR